MARKKASEAEVKVNRRKSEERRTTDRRTNASEVADERRQNDRRKVSRRRQIDPTTCERDYTDEEIEFMHALDEYKRKSGRMFPTCSEILEVIRALGYERLADKGTIDEAPLETFDPNEADVDTVPEEEEPAVLS